MKKLIVILIVFGIGLYGLNAHAVRQDQQQTFEPKELQQLSDALTLPHQ